MEKKLQQSIKTSEAISTVVGRGTRIKGSIIIKNSGRIDGHVEGDVTSDQDIVVGEGGIIEGQVISRNAIIGGRVLGPVNAVKRVVLEEKADLRGNVQAEQLKVSDGARFNGYCFMLREREQKHLTS